MNLRSKNSIRFVIQIFLMTWVVFGSCDLFGMEALAEEAEIALRSAGIEDTSEIFAASRDAITERFGNLTSEQMTNLGEDIRASLKANLKDIAEEIKSKYAGEKEIDVNTFKEELFNNVIKDQKIQFFKAVEEKFPGGVDEFRGSLLDEMGDVPQEYRAKYGRMDSLHFNADSVGVKPDSEVSAGKTNEQTPHDMVNVTEKDLQDFLKNPGEISEKEFKSQIESYKKTIDDAKSAYKESSAANKEAVDKASQNARIKRGSAEAELKTAKSSGQGVDEAKIKLGKAKEAVADSDKAVREVEVRQSYEKFQQAKAARESAELELKKAKEIFKGTEKEGEIADAQKAFDESDEAYKKASKDFKDNASFLKKGWGEYAGERAKLAGRELPNDAWSVVKGTGEATWGGVKWVGEKGWGLAKNTGELLFQAGAFMVPQLIMDKINEWAQKLALVDTLNTVQVFGLILQKLPGDFINEADPIQSFFMYVGVPDKNQKLTKEFLETANYYVSKTDFGELATSAITDPNFPHVMLHLNTGFVFVGDGVSFNEEKPTISLLDKNDKENLLEALEYLEGRAIEGPKGESYQMFSMKATGYAGDKNIAALFDKPIKGDDESYPPLLQRTLNALQSGTKFGDYLVQGFRGLGTKDKNDIAMWNLLSQGSASETALHSAAPNDPYVGWGVYIYQTKDTPFIKNIRSSLSPDDIDQKVAAQDLVDYVVMLDEDFNIVPLQTPQGQLPSNYASYTLNPDAVYMVSLLDTSLTAYEINKNDSASYDKGKTLDELLANINSDLKNKADPKKLEWAFKQIGQMQGFIEQHAQFGPFNVGSTTMTITKDLIAKKIYIYKVSGYLGGGVDDYVIAIDSKRNILQLPGAPSYFVSLVTSRVYDGLFKPKKVTVTYYVMQQPGRSDEQVTTDKSLFPGSKEICSGKAPLFTLFVEADLNPTKCNGVGLPNDPQWALKQYKIAIGEEKPLPILDYLTANESELLTAIEQSQAAWRASVAKADPAVVAEQMGPFNFTPEGSLQDIQITAVNEAAIINQNFVYVSKSYPDEYLVLSTDQKGSDVGKAYNPGNPQRYVVSLSNGYVYSGDAQEGKVPGERVAQKPLPLEAILAKAQEVTKYSPELLAAIDHTEKVYNARIARNLYGSKIDFAQFKFYIAKEDYLAGQFIYADVSKLGSPLDENGNPVPSVIDQIDNYFVCVERTASTDSCDSGCPPVMEGTEQAMQDGKPLYWHYDFGNEVSGDTYAVASLVSGASYDRNNNYLGSYDQFLIKGSTIVDIAGFTTRTFEEIKKKSGSDTVRLSGTINKLLHDLIARIKAEQDAIADAEASYNKLFGTTLGSNLKKTLDELPYIDNPNLLPRYLKYYATSGKYYAVTPGYVSSPKPTEDTPSDGPGPDRMYTDYNLDVQGTHKDAYGMIYNSDGKPVVLLGPDKIWVETTVIDPKTKKEVKTRKKSIVGPGWALQVARAFAGINVDKNGKQTRTIGITSPSVPMGDGTTSYLIPTGFETLKDTKHNNTFEFLYHTKIDTFFVKVTTPSKAYYINLTSGYAYNLDGKPRWFESPIYTTSDSGDMLFIGADQFDILKVALYKAKTKEFAYYTMVGNFAAQMTKGKFNARGTYCVMVNDEDPDSKIQLFQATKDATTSAPLSYYLVWDISTVNNVTSTPVLVGQFNKDEKLAYSLLLYTQTRNKGEPIEKGTFVDDDNYIDPTAEVKKPKTVGIIFDKDHKITSVIYQNQLCPLQGSSITVKNTDGTSRTVGVTQSKKSFVAQGTSPLADLTAEWISFEDGGKIYDYEYDIYVLNTQPELQSIQKSASQLNLYNLKHGDPDALKGGSSTGGFGLNVTTYVPASRHNKDAKKEGPKEQVSGVALASILSADTHPSESEVVFPPNLLQGFKDQALANLSYIYFDDQGSLFINKVVSGVTKRFVYRLGQTQDNGKAYATPGIEGWFIDLSNGILYDTEGFPSGISLTAPQLYALLDTLQLSVVYDKDGNSKLSYRFVTAEPTGAKSGTGTVTPRPSLPPARRVKPRAQMRRSKKPLRLAKPSVKQKKQALSATWSMPEPARSLPQVQTKRSKK